MFRGRRPKKTIASFVSGAAPGADATNDLSSVSARITRGGTRVRTLEPRMVFDAAADATLHQGPAAADMHNPQLAPIDHSPVPPLWDALLPGVAETMETHSASVEAKQAVIFIDESINDIAGLVTSISKPDADIVLLDAAKDGVQQIAAFLEGRTGISAIHIISHGGEGALSLGTSFLSTQTMQGEYLALLATIGNSLLENGDILIYGCDFASGQAGSQAAMMLGGITGADIAASTDLTGAADLGGDWLLEHKIGTVDAVSIHAATWQGVLAHAPVVDLNSTPSVSVVVGTATSNLVMAGDFGTIAAATPPSPWTESPASIFANVVLNGSDGRWDWIASPGAGTLTQALTVPSATSNSFNGAHSTAATTTSDAITSISFELGWQDNDVTNNTGSTNVLSIAYGGTVYATFTTASGVTADKPGVIGNWAYFNGASGPVATTASVANEVTGTLTAITINLPVGVPSLAASGNLVFSYNNAGPTTNSVDDIAIDNVAVTSTATTTTTATTADTADNDWAVIYKENGSAVVIADADSSIFDSDSPDLASATIVLTNQQAGDALLVDGSNAASGTVNGIGYARTAATVTLTGSFSRAQYADALELVSFHNSSDNPDTAVVRDITVVVNDGTDDSNIAHAFVTVASVNDAPAGDDNIITFNEDTPVTLAAADFGFSDSDSNIFQAVKITTLPANGTLRNNDAAIAAGDFIAAADIVSGKLVWTPASNVNGTGYASFTFQVQDDGGTANTGVDLDPSANAITFNITPVNDAPVDGNEIESVTEDMTISVPAAAGLLANTADIDGDAPIVSAFVIAGENGRFVLGTDYRLANTGTVRLNSDGSYSFTPVANFHGAGPVISYTVHDRQGGTDSSTLTFFVVPANDAPASPALPPLTSQDGAVISHDVTGMFYDLDGDALAFTVDALPPGLSFNPANGLVTGMIASDASQGGTGGIYTVTVTARDGHGGLLSRSFTWTVTNPAPLAADDALSLLEDSSATVTVLVNDFDADGDPLSVTSAAANHGTVTINPDGTLTYTPGANYSGHDTILYGVTDSDGGNAMAGVAVTVAAVNDIPAALPLPTRDSRDGATVALPVAHFFADADTGNTAPDVLTYSASGLPRGLSISPLTGLIGGTIAHDASLDGRDGVHTVTVTATDNAGASVQGTFAWTVTNPPPEARADAVVLAEDSSTTATLVTNDSDPDRDFLVYATTPVTGPAHGSVTIRGDGSYDYMPDANFAGTDSFVYQVSDGNGGAATATVTITVLPENELPEANPDVASTNEDLPVTVAVLSNDVDADADPLTIIAASAAHGAVTINTGGTITYVPEVNFNGTDTISYSVSDGQGGTSASAVSVLVSPVNDEPVATGETAVTIEDQPVTVAVLSHASDADGDALSVISATATQGTVWINPDGTLTYRPDPNSNGRDTIRYMISDGMGGTASATLTVTVLPVNDIPAAADQLLAIEAGEAANGTVAASDSDNDRLSFVAGAPPAHGTVFVAADGNFRYVPASGWSGYDTFAITVSDGNGGIASATVGVTTAPDEPSAPLPQPALPADPARAVAMPDLPSVAGGGFVIDAVQSIDRMANMAGSPGGERPIEAAIYNLRPLAGIAYAGGHSIQSHELSRAVARLERGNLSALNGSGFAGPALFRNATFADASSQFVLQGDMIGGRPDEVRIESVRSKGVVYLQLADRSASGSPSDVRDYRLRLANGESVPKWLRRTGPETFAGTPDANARPLDLIITVIRRDGLLTEHAIRFDPLSAQLSTMPGRADKTVPSSMLDRVPLFSEQLELSGSPRAVDITNLERALGLR